MASEEKNTALTSIDLNAKSESASSIDGSLSIAHNSSKSHQQDNTDNIEDKDIESKTKNYDGPYQKTKTLVKEFTDLKPGVIQTVHEEPSIIIEEGARYNNYTTCGALSDSSNNPLRSNAKRNILDSHNKHQLSLDESGTFDLPTHCNYAHKLNASKAPELSKNIKYLSSTQLDQDNIAASKKANDTFINVEGSLTSITDSSSIMDYFLVDKYYNISSIETLDEVLATKNKNLDEDLRRSGSLKDLVESDVKAIKNKSATISVDGKNSEDVNLSISSKANEALYVDIFLAESCVGSNYGFEGNNSSMFPSCTMTHAVPDSYAGSSIKTQPSSSDNLVLVHNNPDKFNITVITTGGNLHDNGVEIKEDKNGDSINNEGSKKSMSTLDPPRLDIGMMYDQSPARSAESTSEANSFTGVSGLHSLNIGPGGKNSRSAIDAGCLSINPGSR